MRFCM